MAWLAEVVIVVFGWAVEDELLEMPRGLEKLYGRGSREPLE